MRLFVQIPILVVNIWRPLLWILSLFIDTSENVCHTRHEGIKTQGGTNTWVQTPASIVVLRLVTEHTNTVSLRVDSWWSNHDLLDMWCWFAHIQTTGWSSLIHLRKRKCHVSNIFLAGSCQNYNFRCNQWWKLFLTTWCWYWAHTSRAISILLIPNSVWVICREPRHEILIMAIWDAQFVRKDGLCQKKSYLPIWRRRTARYLPPSRAVVHDVTGNQWYDITIIAFWISLICSRMDISSIDIVYWFTDMTMIRTWVSNYIHRWYRM